MRLSIGYPDRDAEIDALQAHGDDDRATSLKPVLTAAQVNGLVAAARGVHVAPALQGYVVDLAEASLAATGPPPWACRPASLALQKAARACAATRGRTFVIPDDIKALAHPVLDHRIILSPEAQVGGISAADVVDDVLASVAVPAPQAADAAG